MTADIINLLRRVKGQSLEIEVLHLQVGSQGHIVQGPDYIRVNQVLLKDVEVVQEITGTEQERILTIRITITGTDVKGRVHMIAGLFRAVEIIPVIIEGLLIIAMSDIEIADKIMIENIMIEIVAIAIWIESAVIMIENIMIGIENVMIGIENVMIEIENATIGTKNVMIWAENAAIGMVGTGNRPLNGIHLKLLILDLEASKNDRMIERETKAADRGNDIPLPLDLVLPQIWTAYHCLLRLELTWLQLRHRRLPQRHSRITSLKLRIVAGNQPQIVGLIFYRRARSENRATAQTERVWIWS